MGWLRWAVYLGVSWTWCIGMFLPVLLVRDFGFWAWVVFAVPNVLGAAAMGFVIRDGVGSQRMVERHKWEMAWFSRVTIAYQAFFAAWMLPQLIGWWTAGLYPLVLLIVVAAVKGDREFSLTTGMAYVFSVVVGLVLWRGGYLVIPEGKGVGGAGMLAPVCLLGFMLCPYLDLTFHRAYQKAFDANGGWGARGAFAAGFGVVFASMIVLTVLYAKGLLNGVQAAGFYVGAHMLVQLAVTIALHHVETTRAVGTAVHPVMRVGSVLAIATGVGLVCWAMPPVWGGGGWDPGEYVYRAFLGSYGLVFPALVLMRMLPGMGRGKPMGMAGVVGVCAAALPFYVAGFFSTQPVWMLPGVGIVLGAGVVANVRR